MSTKSKYQYQSIIGILHDKGININFKNYDARTKPELDLPNLGEPFDCSTRAFCTVFGVSYDEIFDKQLALSKSMHLMPTNITICREIAKQYGYRFYRFRFPMNLIKFYALKPKGRYILNSTDHLFAYIDGVVYDRNVKEYTRLCENFTGLAEDEEDDDYIVDKMKYIEDTWYDNLIRRIYGVYHPNSEDNYWNQSNEEVKIIY